jgi:hypothetical protein
MMKKYKHHIAAIILTLLPFGCSSLMTSLQQYKIVDQLVENEKFEDAAQTFQQSKEEFFDTKDRVLYWIDLGLLQHYARMDSQAIINLQAADFAIEELYTQSISKGVASMLLNDNALDYSGEDYENIYINVFKSLSYYRENNTEEALVEIRRLLEKFVTMEQKYDAEISALQNSDEIKTDVEKIDIAFYSSALSHYISMILFYNDFAFDDARISKEKLYQSFDMQKELFNFPKPNFDSLIKNNGKPKLSFLTFLGRSPIKYEYVFSVDTYKDLVTISTFENGRWQSYSSISWYGIQGGLHAKFAVPKMQKRGSIVSKVEVYVNNIYKTDLVKLESLEDIAFETFKRKEGIIYLKSLARTITKAIANEELNKELDKQTGGGDWGDLTRLISGALINATENADLRITHYFPAYAYAGNFDIAPGNYNIKLIYKDSYNRTIATDTFDNYQVANNKKIDLIETYLLK